MVRRPLPNLASLCAVLLAVAAPPTARAQSGGHPGLAGPRPLEARLAEADAAALVRVEEVTEGRLRVVAERRLTGALPERFAIKRSPLRPPPLAEGDRALLFLAGARPPYRWLGTPSEVLRFESEQEARRAGDVVAALAAQPPPATWSQLHLEALDAGPDLLRELALAALLARGSSALTSAQLEERAAAALDATRDVGARTASARLASASARAARQLLAGVPALDTDAPGALEVARIALRAAALRGAPADRAAYRAALLGALDHESAGLRETAAEAVAPGALGEAAVATRLAALEASDPDPRVRSAAHRALARARRPAPALEGSPDGGAR